MRDNRYTHHTHFAGAHPQRQGFLGRVQHDWIAFFVLGRQLNTDLDLHRLVDHILQNQDHLNWLIDVRPAWEDSQRALQVVHANARPASDRTQDIRVHWFKFFGVIPHIC